MRIMVTGGAGFIGSALTRHLVLQTENFVVNIDKLTYAGNLDSLAAVSGKPNYRFEKIDIRDASAVREVFDRHCPDAVMHLAAESHVDRSIDGPSAFIDTNIIGTYTLLEAALAYFRQLPGERKDRFRFLHVSTDEVFGSLKSDGFFDESTPYRPNSPYSASKAGSDHLVRAWHHTYGLPVLITNCSNNYGPYQFPEKLIPVVILNALNGQKIPVYGKGENIRDWLFVDDHVQALLAVLERGKPGETYNIGGKSERKNLEIVKTICRILDELVTDPIVCPFDSLIGFVTDRPGHDLRYAIDPTKIENELGWRPSVTFEQGIEATVRWYLKNRSWCDNILSGRYRLQRLGLG